MIEYKGYVLAKGSECLKLYDEKKFKELDQLIKQLDQKEKDLIKRYRE